MKENNNKLILGMAIGIAIGFIIAFMVVNGYDKKYNISLNKPSILPQSLESAAEDCKVSADALSKEDYCTFFNKVIIDRTIQYATCAFSPVHDLVKSPNKGTLCDGVGVKSQEDISQSFCFSEKVKEDGIDKILVNGKTCESWLDLKEGMIACTGKEGFYKVAEPREVCYSGEIDITNYLTFNARNSLGDNKCCAGYS